jgi:gliding motility-associated-like protein
MQCREKYQKITNMKKQSFILIFIMLLFAGKAGAQCLNNLTAVISGGTSPICYNTSPGTFTATGGGESGSYTYLWYQDGVSTGVTTQTFDPGTLTLTSSFYCAISSGPCGPVNTSTTTITVIDNASIGSVTGVTPICVGATGTYLANAVVLGGGTGLWSSDNIAVATVNSSGVVTGVSAGTCNIIYTITGGCGGTVFSQQSVTITGSASIGSVTGPTPLCVGATGTYLANAAVFGGGTGSWSSNNTAVATVNSSGIVTGVSAGTCNIIYTITGGCGGTVSALQAVTINQNASITLTSAAGTNNQTLCSNATITDITYLINGGGSGAGVTGLPTGVSGVYNTGVFTINGVPTVSGTFTYTVTTTGTCTQATATGTLTVNPLPTPTLTSSAPGNVSCSGTNVTFTASGGTSYSFRIGSVIKQTGTSNIYITNILTNGNIVYVVVTNAGGCSATSAGIFNFVNSPPFIFITTAANCSTDLSTYSLAVTVSAGTVNSTAGIVNNSGGNVWTITGVPSGTNITVTVTDSGGCQNSLPVSAPNCSCPIVLAPVSGGNKSYCAGGIIPAINATVLTGETVDWYNASSGGTLLSGGSLSYTPTAAGTYYALARNTTTNCVSSTRTSIIVTMNPLPVPTLTSSDADNIFCSGTSEIFTAGGGTGFNFRVGGVSVQSGALTTYTTATLTNGQVVDVIVTNTNGCSATSAGITNTVNALPVPTLTSSDADNTFCVGTSVTFTAGGGTNYNFRVGGVSVQNGATTTYTTNSLTNGQIVDVIVINANGCIATSAGITNSVYVTPTADAGTGGNNCGLTFHFNGSLNVGTGTWSKVSGPGNATFSPDANTANAVVTVTAYGSYVFRWTVVNGTCSTNANVTIVFIQQPPANAGSGGNSCNKEFLLNALVPVTGTGTWTKASGTGNAVFSPDNHQANAKVTVDQFGSYDFVWTVVNSTCTSGDHIIVVFHDLPAISAGKDTTICKGSGIQLLAVGAGTVSWVPASLVSNPNIINPIATPDTTTTFTIHLTDQFGCKNSDSLVVEVRDKITANAGPDQMLGYQFTTTMGAMLVHSYENGVWSVLSGTGDIIDSTYASTTVKGLSVGENIFLWTVKNGFCPISHDTVIITVNNFVIPSLITPNMDGRNDYFVLRGLATLGKTELVIFDRRGVQVYKNLNYDNSWNGVDYNKNPLPDDTYFYVIKTANRKSISGYVVIRH